MDALSAGFALVLDPYVLAVIAGAAVFGLVVGAIPGLTATMATALLVPVTFFMEPVPAIGAIVTASAMAIFAGDIPATLLRIPGTPSSAAYTDEAYAMARGGRAELALGIALVCSALGGLVGTVVLVLVAPSLAELALHFTSVEYFWLAVLGLSCAALISSGSPLRGVISLLIGLLLACIGEDIMSGYARFSFGNAELAGGIGLIPAMIGMFAVSELLRTASTLDRPAHAPLARLGGVFTGLAPVLARYWRNMLRGWTTGTLIGALPGAGAGMAAWVSMALAKRFSAEPQRFGSGHPEGLVEATSANNAGLSGAWVPALVFGIPGDTITAIVIGVLYMKGMTPGPTVFMHSADLLNALFIIFFMANIAMLGLGWVAIRGARHIVDLPRALLTPVILLFCMVGAFAINASLLGVIVILVLGVVAWFMEENDIPIAPAILGLVLGRMLEENFLMSMAKSRGDLIGLVDRPVAASLAAVTVVLWTSPALLRLWRRARAGAGTTTQAAQR